MTTRSFLTRAAPSTPSTTRRAGPVLSPDSPLIASPEEQERREREHRRLTDAKIAVLDASLNAVFACQCCGGVAGPGALCNPCKAVAVQLRAEAAMSDLIAGRTRRDLVADYLENRT